MRTRFRATTPPVTDAPIEKPVEKPSSALLHEMEKVIQKAVAPIVARHGYSADPGKWTIYKKAFTCTLTYRYNK